MNEQEQELLARIIDLFAEKFGKQAVLRGGMVLRVLGSARYTNDLDYVFIPYKSKKDIVPEVLKCLESIESASVKHSLNSKCLRVVLTVDDTIVQIEAKVALEMKTMVATTKLLSPRYQLPKRLIHIVDHSVSMANKLAAWNERRLVRDLYDIWFFIQMEIKPDIDTLETRLRKVNYSRLVKKEDYFTGKTVENFYEFLRKKVSEISDQDIEEQMSDYLLPEEMVGLSMLFKAALVKLK